MPDQAEYLHLTPPLTDEQRETLERELLPLTRFAALGALTADIAHDLANPLFAVLGHVDLLLTEAAPGSATEERLRLVRQTALELKDDLRVLLDYARPPEGGDRAELDAAVRGAIALVTHGHARELEVATAYADHPVVVRCPSDELAQAALHLVGAARAAVGDAGSIRIAVTADGALHVEPATADSVYVIAAGRIADSHGGSLAHDGDALVLRLPLWIAS
jgi:signal transduction histidine kinase